MIDLLASGLARLVGATLDSYSERADGLVEGASHLADGLVRAVAQVLGVTLGGGAGTAGSTDVPRAPPAPPLPIPPSNPSPAGGSSSFKAGASGGASGEPLDEFGILNLISLPDTRIVLRVRTNPRMLAPDSACGRAIERPG